MERPYGYGRIVTDTTTGSFQKIVEEKDCSVSESRICLVNSGIYCFDTDALSRHISSIENNNAQQEFYLTDVVEIIRRKENCLVEMVVVPSTNQHEISGVNTKEQLGDLESIHEVLYFLQSQKQN
jgi:bifunctional UDP-N-acetylglucosamine pyrophosphorylase/glucosamine-1-phosphate N-acetyltransferase